MRAVSLALTAGVVLGCAGGPIVSATSEPKQVHYTVKDKAFTIARYEARSGWAEAPRISKGPTHEPSRGALFATTADGVVTTSCGSPAASSPTLSPAQLRPLFMELASSKSDPVVINDAVRVDVDGDGELEELIVAESTTKDGALTAIIIVKDDRFRTVATFDTWTKFRIIKEACTDADDDGVPEVIVESLEFGSLGYRLMEWDGRALQSLGYGQP